GREWASRVLSAGSVFMAWAWRGHHDAGCSVRPLTTSRRLQRLPVEHVLRAIEGIERAAERRQHGVGDGLRGPAAVPVGNALGARLAHEEYLVLAHREDLACHFLGKVTGQEHAKRCDL